MTDMTDKLNRAARMVKVARGDYDATMTSKTRRRIANLHRAFGDVAEICVNGGGGVETALYIDIEEGTVELAENAERMDCVEEGVVPTVAEVRRWMKQGYTD
jgi:hypothetical protein